MTKIINYRPEIDGLRAIAVLAVIFYHLELPLGLIPLNGGFIGVDIFFVISGYLISKIIVKDVTNDSFSFNQFYLRRAKRILPVLILVILLSIPVSWFLLIPDSFSQYSNSILSSLFFTSNILFFMEDSYTSVASKFKPFLHTWSLSLEEQFYLFFPVVILVINKFFNKYLLSFLVIFFLLSLNLSVYSSIRFPDENFYLIPTRAWELLAGSLIAIYEFKHGRFLNNFTDLLPAIGLSAIIHSLVFFNNNTLHPSLITLIPIIGVCLLILFMRPGEFVCDILSSRSFLYIGVISYALYIWHYPIIVFLRIAFDGLDIYLKIVSLILTFLFSVFTYHTVEKFFRYNVSNKSFFLVSIASTTFIIIFCIGSLITNGYDFRFDNLKNENQRNIYSQDARLLNEKLKKQSFNNTYYFKNFDSNEWSTNPDKKFLLIGDSHLDSWAYAFSNVYKEPSYISLKYLGCNFSVKNSFVKNLTDSESEYFDSCKFTSDILNDNEVINSLNTVVLASHRPFSYSSNSWRFKLLNHINSINPSVKIFILGNYFQTHPDFYCLNIMMSMKSDASKCLSKYVYPPLDYNYKSDIYYYKLDGLDYEYIDVISPVCETNNISSCPFEYNGIPFMEDWNHLTPAFNEYLLTQLLLTRPNLFK